MWASLEDDRINLYVMKIGKRGTHDLRIYRYRLEGEKMTLSFERHRDENRLQVIRGGMMKKPARTNLTDATSPGQISDHTMPDCA